MIPPFTIEQFLGVFASYNVAIWPAQIIVYATGLVSVVALWIKSRFTSRIIFLILTIMWVVNGIGYHFLFFATINPAAQLFAAFFVLQAFLFVAAAFVTKASHFKLAYDFRSFAGLTAIVYAMLIYPVLGIVAGHGLMRGPMFGVAPCPTTIFTIGMLLLARGRWVAWLSVIPFLWSLIGFAAATQLGIVEDVALPIAGLLLLIMLGLETYRNCLGKGLARPADRSAQP